MFHVVMQRSLILNYIVHLSLLTSTIIAAEAPQKSSFLCFSESSRTIGIGPSEQRTTVTGVTNCTTNKGDAQWCQTTQTIIYRSEHFTQSRRPKTDGSIVSAGCDVNRLCSVHSREALDLASSFCFVLDQPKRQETSQTRICCCPTTLCNRPPQSLMQTNPRRGRWRRKAEPVTMQANAATTTLSTPSGGHSANHTDTTAAATESTLFTAADSTQTSSVQAASSTSDAGVDTTSTRTVGQSSLTTDETATTTSTATALTPTTRTSTAATPLLPSSIAALSHYSPVNATETWQLTGPTEASTSNEATLFSQTAPSSSSEPYSTEAESVTEYTNDPNASTQKAEASAMLVSMVVVIPVIVCIVGLFLLCCCVYRKGRGRGTIAEATADDQQDSDMNNEIDPLFKTVV